MDYKINRRGVFGVLASLPFIRVNNFTTTKDLIWGQPLKFSPAKYTNYLGQLFSPFAYFPVPVRPKEGRELGTTVLYVSMNGIIENAEL